MRLDNYDKLPSGMEEYLSIYGWHFSKKMCEWAVSRMIKKEGNTENKIEPITKDKVKSLLDAGGIVLKKDAAYDSVYVANMCKADYLGSSIRNEAALATFVKDTIDDPDGYEGLPFTRFYADCIGSGTPIMWEDMI